MDAYQLHAALPSWRPTTARRRLVEFLLAVTDGPDAVPPAERLATFDNDGTLACEKPRTALAEFLIAESAAQLSPDTGAPGGQQVLRELGALFEGQSATEYERRSSAFLDRARHPRFNRRYESLVYAPMRELIELLHRLKFSVFLCSDSSRDFLRILAGPAYGLPRERVIGSEVQLKLRDGQLVRTATPAPFDDGPGKAVHIWDRAGRMPLLAAGNAVGDIEMLTAARYSILIHHDDQEREYAYNDNAALAAAQDAGWTVVSMREDFETIWVPPADPTPPLNK